MFVLLPIESVNDESTQDVVWRTCCGRGAVRLFAARSCAFARRGAHHLGGHALVGADYTYRCSCGGGVDHPALDRQGGQMAQPLAQGL